MSVAFTISALTGCQPADPVGEPGGEFEMPQSPEPEPRNAPEGGGELEEMPQAPDREPQEPEELDIEDLGMPDQEVPEPDPVDIEDPDRAPDTVLATVEGEDITLQDLYDEFDRIPPQQQQQIQHRQPELLDEMIQQRLLREEAREKGVEESGEYREMLQQIEASPMVAELDEDEIKETAMIEILLQREVVEKVDISEEDLRESFDQYAQMMPEDADFEEMKPHLERMMLQEHVMNYIRQLQEDSEVDINEGWLEEKEEEAMEARPPMMPVEPDPQEPEEQEPVELPGI